MNLAQRSAALASGICLLISLALVVLAATSNQHMLSTQQESIGAALAQQIAHSSSDALATGDLLSTKASLQRFIDATAAEEVSVYDIEGNPLSRAGHYQGLNPVQFSAPVLVQGDTAGKVVITLGADQTIAAQRRFIFTLLGLAVLLSLGAYGVVRHLSQRVSDKLVDLATSIDLSTDAKERAGFRPGEDELRWLSKKIDALPMELLRARGASHTRDENYQTTAVLYLQLNSMVEYVDTLDQHLLQRYTQRLHQIVFGAAGFYAGNLQVVRQFGLAVYFSGENPAGSEVFRAASCAWLVQELSKELEKKLPLSMSVSMAITQSELGVGDEADLYPGLYMQHTLDELQSVCASKPPKILLSPLACEDTDIAGRLEHHSTELQNYEMLVDFENPYKDLLERQLRLIWKRLAEMSRK